MADPCVTAMCWNPHCGKPLNHYAHGVRVDGRERLFCTASCFNAFRREERWTQRIMNIFSVHEPLPGLFCEVGDEGKTQAEAQKWTPVTVQIAVITIVIATVTAFS